jgi:soluble lytic murein transglycosylase
MLARTAFITTLTIALALSPVRGQEGSATSGRLVPTRHPVMPAELSQFWLVDHGRARVDTGAVEEFARGVQLINAGNFSAGLPLVSAPALARTPWAAYAQYYTGVALMSLARHDAANVAFETAAASEPDGYLRQALPLRLAEVALARGDHRRVIDLLEPLAEEKVSAPDGVLLQLARAAERAGDTARALKAYRTVYYELPLTSGAVDAGEALARLEAADREPPDKLERDLERAEALFAARRWAAARDAFAALTKRLRGDEAARARLRLAQCDYRLDRFRAAREALAPFLDGGRHEAEARYYHLSAVRGLGDRATFVTLATRLAQDHPTSPWSEEALNDLASHHIRLDEDEDADRVFRQMLKSFPRGQYGDRAAWRVGWRAYRQRDFREAAETFERAAAAFPRADYRPSWLYWSGKARDRLNESAVAVERYAITIADYGSSYYGRLAEKALSGRRTPAYGILTVSTGGSPAAESRRPQTIATDRLVRDLVALGLYDDALREVQYAQRVWGDSPQLQATTAYIRHHQGLTLKAEERFGAVRGAINTMRRAYPHFMTAAGDQLPPEVLRIIFPIDYWPLITKYSKQNGLDPYLVAALMAQESTFTAEIRSSANAYGLMQIIPATGSRYARKVGIRNFSTRMLTNPETNIRLGTEYFKDLMARFGAAHYALAGYNAGEGRVQQWLNERGELPADEFTDDIPFNETQLYVKRILGTADDYRRLYGGGLLDPAASLSAQAAAAVAASSKAATPAATKPATPKPATKAPATKKPAPRTTKPARSRRS